MCGIAGFVGQGDLADLRGMLSTLVHRGPDGEGTHVDPDSGVHLGHRRLVVIDSEGGHQPLWNEDATVGVVFNGEIYNHAELRLDLERRGHRFRSHHSDTEVLVHGWEEWGTDLPSLLNGMFAFAILDRRAGRIILVRDRFGEKPLYLLRRNGVLVFASELTAIMAHPACSRRISVRALQKLFGYGFLPSPHSLIEGVEKLPPGHLLEWDLSSGRCEVRAWWIFRLESDESWVSRHSVDELAEDLRARLNRAVARRCRADVPLGILLSGGVDSSAILALARCHLPTLPQTFTLGFNEPSYDERGYARLMAASAGSMHHEEVLDLAAARELIPQVLGRMDEPLIDGSLIPTALLCRFARRHVTVALGGDGGDELFAGYDPFAALRSAQIYDALVPRWLHRQGLRLVDLLPRTDRNMSLDFRLRRMLLGLSHAEQVWNPVWMSPVGPSLAAEVFHAPLPIEDLFSEAIDMWNADPGSHIVDRTLTYFTRLYLCDGILAKTDRAAMQVGLEVRSVFLDPEVVEFCERLPHRFKMRGGQRKWILKRALRGLVPDGILGRRKKGFGMPVAQWLREMPVPSARHAITGMIDGAAERWWSAHRERTADHRLGLWGMLSTHLSRAVAGASS